MTAHAAKHHVLIGIPSLDRWERAFALSLMQLAGYSSSRSIGITVFNKTGSLLPRNRHQIVQQALRSEATHLLFVDTDMTFPPDTLERLLAHGKQAVGALCPVRDHATHPSSNAWVKLGRLNGTPEVKVPFDRSLGLVEVEAIGTGILLIETAAFRKVPAPWFELLYQRAEDEYLSEDFYLCLKMRAEGIPFYADASFAGEIGHVGSHVYCGRNLDGVLRNPWVRPGDWASKLDGTG